jgi:hypothetical protein
MSVQAISIKGLVRLAFIKVISINPFSGLADRGFQASPFDPERNVPAGRTPLD